MFLTLNIILLLKLLPLGSIGGYSLPYYTKENILTKSMIFKIFEEDDALLQYLPDKPNLKTIPRDFLLCVMANIRREKYASMYAKYKDIKAQRSTVGNKVYKAQITNDFKNGLNHFSPINL